ncbi:MAG: VOC family protein [Chthoniobacter sp.]|uniref:VOC family protein n=1 Tax=Chthoniobacter sp. TaxID=2510640 RepID=UPI0032A7F375
MSPPTKNSHFRGIYTVLYRAPDITQAKAWYAAVLGIEPYFDQPFYVGFNVSGYELGLHPEMAEGSGSSVAYWGVADAQASMARLLSLGAREHSAVVEVGDGIKVGTVFDPFDNIFGVIENPHFALPA